MSLILAAFFSFFLLEVKVKSPVKNFSGVVFYYFIVVKHHPDKKKTQKKIKFNTKKNRLARNYVSAMSTSWLWKYFTPFPQQGCPEGYQRTRADYRPDFDRSQPYINRYRFQTEAVVGIHGTGVMRSQLGFIQGKSPRRSDAGKHRERMSMIRGKGNIGGGYRKGNRKGLRYGMPWERKAR